MRIYLLRLLSWLLLTFVLLTAAMAKADVQYGWIQIRVIKPNLLHTTSVQMHLNGIGFVGFSHAQSSDLRIPVLGKFLARTNSGVTPVSTDYSGLQSDCEFDYSVYLVVASGGQSIFLGQYHAPTQAMTTTIPLAICPEKNQLCSADHGIQQSIELELRHAEERRRIDSYNQWKRGWDTRQTAILSTEADNAKKATALQAVSENEQAKPLRQVEKEVEEIEVEANIARKEEAAMAVPPSENEANAPLTDVTIDQQLYELASQAQQDRVERLVQEALEAHLITPDLADFYRGAAATSAFFADVSASRLAELDCSGEWRMSDCLSAKLAMDSAEFVDQNLTRSSVLGEIAELGVRSFTVYGDVIDGCEAILALEGCRMDGRKLAPWERGFAAIGVVVGSGEAYRKLVKRNPWLSDFLDIKAVELLEHWEPKSLEHVIVGNLHQYGGGKIVITGGLHTSRGIEQFLAKGGAAPIRDVVAENGVRVVAWAESSAAFSPRGLDGTMKVLVDGAELPIKTLFPSSWGVNKVVGVVHGIAARCVNANGACVEIIDGITVKVVKINNLVTTAFPVLDDEVLRILLRGGST